MSESTEELKTAVEGASEVLTDTATMAEQLSGQATELAEEAAGHGWHGISTRMQEVAEALEATAGQIATGGMACENAIEDLCLISDKVPAGEVVGHLRASTNQLGEAETALQGAVEKAEEAQAAAAEIGQEGMMQATLDLYGRLTEIHEQIDQLRSTSEEEQTAAEVYAQKQLTLGGARGSPTPPPSTAPPVSAEEAAERRSFGGEGKPSITAPSRPSDPNAKPRGYPATWKPTDNPETERGRRRENESAQVLAEHGYDIEQNPNFSGGKRPDFRIEGKVFDNFTPKHGTNIRNVWSAAKFKVREKQSRRVILNLDDSDATVDQLKEQFSNWHIPGLEEVIAIRNHEIYQVFPRMSD